MQWKHSIVMTDCLKNSMQSVTQVNSAFYPPWDKKMNISFWAE